MLTYDIGFLVLHYYPPSHKQNLVLCWDDPFNIKGTISEITYEIKDGKALKTKIACVNHFKQFSTEER